MRSTIKNDTQMDNAARKLTNQQLQAPILFHHYYYAYSQKKTV